MTFDPQLILIYCGPIFLVCIVAELFYLRRHAHLPDSAQYTANDTFSNIGLALMHEGSELVAALVVISIYYWVFDFRLLNIPTTWWSIILLFFLQDFLYYWFHRASHRIRWMWASHVVHHSSEKMNFSTAFRQSLTYPISGMWVFWIPLMALGFEPMTVVGMVLFNLAYQFFIHTQVVGKLGFLEKFMSTPSHHRVHHARNNDYIDKNYAGTLIIWDKMFGTFVEENDNNPCEYGITRQIHSHNPVILSFHEWVDMLKDAMTTNKSLWQRGKHLWGPPEWQPSQEPANNLEQPAVPT